jgi:hypothetical protein
MVKGEWSTTIEVNVPCGAGRPEIHERVIVFKEADAINWVLLPPWEEKSVLQAIQGAR